VPDPWLPFELKGHGGRSLPCLLHAHGDEARIAVVLPGGSRLGGGRIGGTPARRDLSSTHAPAGAGHRCSGSGGRPVRCRKASSTRGCARTRWRRFERPSSGCHCASPSPVAVARHEALAVSREAAVGARPVWFAPLVREAPGLAAVCQAGTHAFVVAGGADSLWDPAAVAAMRAAGVRVVELPGPGRSLEVDDPAEAARPLAGVLDELRVVLAAVVEEAAVDG
jgi:hypothetical protein